MYSGFPVVTPHQLVIVGDETKLVIKSFSGVTLIG
jgi:hypothetical protein